MTYYFTPDSQMLATSIDGEVLNSLFEETLNKKTRFMLRLKGLEFGGVLEEWGVTESETNGGPYCNIDHDVPIIPNRHSICYVKKRFGHHGQYLPLKFTDVILSHYPEEYLVTTHDHYYYLGGRAFTHNNIILKQEFHNMVSGRVILALVDCGRDGKKQKTVVRRDVCERMILQDTAINHIEMIKNDLLRQYKEIIRRGC